MIYKGYGNWWKCHWDKRKLPTHCISEEAFIPLSPKASLIFQFIHLYIHPCIDPSIHHLSIHPSVAALIHPYIHSPKSSHSMSQLPPPVKTKTPLGFVDQKTRGATSDGKRRRARRRARPIVMRRGRMSEKEGQGGSKCQVPLGSGDGGYIYQSKQPGGPEYFTCRCGLLHYHVRESRSVPF